MKWSDVTWSCTYFFDRITLWVPKTTFLLDFRLSCHFQSSLSFNFHHADAFLFTLNKHSPVWNKLFVVHINSVNLILFQLAVRTNGDVSLFYKLLQRAFFVKRVLASVLFWIYDITDIQKLNKTLRTESDKVLRFEMPSVVFHSIPQINKSLSEIKRGTNCHLS